MTKWELQNLTVRCIFQLEAERDFHIEKGERRFNTIHINALLKLDLNSTWVTVHIRFRGAGCWPGKYTFGESFGSCGVLGLLNAGALRLPHLLPKSQLHREDLEQ